MPEVLGREYLPALASAREEGDPPVRIQVTRPSASSSGVGLLRVVGVRPGAEGPEWVLAYEDYRRLPASPQDWT